MMAVTKSFHAMLSGLAGPGATLRVWGTNATAQFVRLPDVAVAADGSFVVSIGRDAMVTVTTLDTGAHGGFPSSPIPASAPFPLPYADDFSGYAEDALARYFSDQAGSFAVRGGALQQVVEAVLYMAKLPPVAIPASSQSACLTAVCTLYLLRAHWHEH
jgi:hypothetical protein